MQERVKTGSEVLDSLLEGGYENDIITTVYGPAGSGKTLLCLLSAIEAARSGKKVIFVDTEGGFSVERLKQLAKNHEEILKNIFFLKPTTFSEQKKQFEKIKSIMSEKIGLIIVDSISMLYRLELKDDEISNVNKDLAQQVGFLTEIARKKEVPVLITNQVYANFDDKSKVNIVGGDVLKYGSKCLIELQITPANNRRAILKKHRSLSAKEAVFSIMNSGIKEVKESKSFLF